MLFFFIGLTGVGKSTVARNVARKMQYSFIDLDALIEMRNGMRVSEIFEFGEDSFRIAETAALMSLDPNSRHVIATGGGIVLREENIEFMRKNGYVVLLERPCEEILKCLSLNLRPLLKENPERLFQLFEERRALYEKAGHIKFSIESGYFDAEKIASELRKVESFSPLNRSLRTEN